LESEANQVLNIEKTEKEKCEIKYKKGRRNERLRNEGEKPKIKRRGQPVFAPILPGELSSGSRQKGFSDQVP
jgi:hypothetical protein